MKDIRLEKLAQVLLERSLNVEAGKNLLIRSTFESKPLLDEVYKQAVLKGLNVFTHVLMPNQIKFFMENATEKQLENAYTMFEETYKKADFTLTIDAPTNVKNLTNVPPQKNVAFNKAMISIMRQIMDKPWVLTNYPTEAFAQEAGMSLEEYEDFLFNAVLVDYEKMDEGMNKILEVFDKADTIRIVGRETDLTFSIKGRKGIKCSGQNNIPDGEVYYAPVTDSVNGYIYYEYPAIRYGAQVDDIRLEFKDGKVVKATASSNEDFLNQMLDTDPGARFIGEFGIGFNYGIKKFIKNILFDEKIGGTIHLAVGNAYEGSGGDNKSVIHWDMVKELRYGGEIYADGVLVQKNGEFLLD